MKTILEQGTLNPENINVPKKGPWKIELPADHHSDGRVPEGLSSLRIVLFVRAIAAQRIETGNYRFEQ